MNLHEALQIVRSDIVRNNIRHEQLCEYDQAVKLIADELEHLQAIDRRGKANAQERVALIEENKKLMAEIARLQR